MPRTLIALVLALPGIASATTLVAGPLRVGNATARLDCRAINVGTKDRVVRIEIVDSDGEVVVDSGDVTIVPGENDGRLSQPGQSVLFCRFTLAGGRRDIRASACQLDAAGACTAALQAQ
jgi:hypothetical protein